MTTRIARRMSAIEPFYVMDVLSRAQTLEAQGRSIVHMEVGEPDFPTPRPVVEAGLRAIERGQLPYTVALGAPALREAISRFYQDHHGQSVPADRIAITPGSSGALLLTMGVLVDPGDEVLLADPGYPCNRQFIRAMGGEPVGIPVGPESGYQLTAEQVEARWTERTRAVLIASPSNPTGTTIEVEALRAIEAVAQRRGGRLIVDEIYQGLTYGQPARTALAVSDQVFVVNSFSKYFDMTGWRLGWMVMPAEYVREVEKLSQNLFICASAPAQTAALAAFAPETLAILEERRRAFQERRDFLLPALRRLGFELPIAPQGAFYLYAGCERFTADSFAFALELLEQAGVAVTPGRDFGSYRPERHLRFAYTTSMENLAEGVQRLERFLASRR